CSGWASSHRNQMEHLSRPGHPRATGRTGNCWNSHVWKLLPASSRCSPAFKDSIRVWTLPSKTSAG
uniref:Uncharacterized protein n=1 Tax=Taeniopygia guttata TaxID=59729 RepID=A0A674HF83_TAEGU